MTTPKKPAKKVAKKTAAKKTAAKRAAPKRVADLCRGAAKALDARLLTAARAYVERAAPPPVEAKAPCSCPACNGRASNSQIALGLAVSPGGSAAVLLQLGPEAMAFIDPATSRRLSVDLVKLASRADAHNRTALS